MEVDGVFADWSNLHWTRRFPIHRQSSWFRRCWMADFAAATLAFFVAGSTRARVPQPLKGVVALVPVLPFDVHALAGSLLHFHRFRIRSRRRQSSGFFSPNSRHLLCRAGFDGLVGHFLQE